jgi:hypothetical protein
MHFRVVYRLQVRCETAVITLLDYGLRPQCCCSDLCAESPPHLPAFGCVAAAAAGGSREGCVPHAEPAVHGHQPIGGVQICVPEDRLILLLLVVALSLQVRREKAVYHTLNKLSMDTSLSLLFRSVCQRTALSCCFWSLAAAAAGSSQEGCVPHAEHPVHDTSPKAVVYSVS